jgi:hypothetical protein
MSDESPKQFMFMGYGKPIELSEVDSFSVEIRYPTPSPDLMGPHRHRARKAVDVSDNHVDSVDLEALKWLREKKGLVEFGKAYRHMSAAGKVEHPERPVTIEIPFFGDHRHVLLAQGVTLRAAVSALADLLLLSHATPEHTYPGHNKLLKKVLAKVGQVDVHVSDLCALIRDYLEEDGHSCGGNLHIYLSDGNVRDGDVEFCKKNARDQNDSAALLIAELLSLLPESERTLLHERGYGR